jgi:uncharacterized membrane protein YdjX (TVP38/TMEM64 family)
MSAPHPLEPARRKGLLRALAIVLACVAVAGLLSVDAIFTGFQRVLLLAEPIIQAHPVLGAVVFVVLAAVSAILAFFSSALLVPAALFTWGHWVTGALLWLGWWLGGLFAYTVGQALRGSAEPGARPPGRFAAYLPTSPDKLGFPLVLLWQLVLPSEIPGYVCGWLGVPRRTYLAAVAVAELPYAVGAVLIGESVLERRPVGLMVLGLLAALLAYLLVRALHARQSR